ncbi:MAG: PilZ domain-containing protein [Phycisphaeraceae bacterium]
MHPAPQAEIERRTEPRIPASHTVKLRGEAAGLRYHTARTCNVSASGALLQLDQLTALRPGERIRLGFADHTRAAVLAAEGMIDAVVLRSLRHEDRQEIAIRFTSPQVLPLAG